jgi:hypothetical protein
VLPHEFVALENALTLPKESSVVGTGEKELVSCEIRPIAILGMPRASSVIRSG